MRSKHAWPYLGDALLGLSVNNTGTNNIDNFLYIGNIWTLGFKLKQEWLFHFTSRSTYTYFYANFVHVLKARLLNVLQDTHFLNSVIQILNPQT
jgi:hypothetical protein